MKKYVIIILIAGLLSACLKKPDVELPPPVNLRPLASIVQNNLDNSIFALGLHLTGLDSILSGKKAYTMFVPDDEAFAAAGITKDSLSHMDLAALKTLIGYHIIPGNYSVDSLPQTIDYPFTSLAGLVLYTSLSTVGVPSTVLHVNGVNVTTANIQASNGVIHTIPSVLALPAPSVKAYLESQPQYSYFVIGLKNFGLLDSLGGTGPWVVIAPTNQAFENHGYDSAAIAALDTLHYKKWLFSSAILPIPPFFHADINLAQFPTSGNSVGNSPFYITSDYMLRFYYDVFGLVPFNFEQIVGPPFYGNPYIYGDQINLDDADHLTLNGVVHGTNGLMAVPDSLVIR